MNLDIKALAATGAVLVGGTLLLVAIGNLVFPGYGDALLELAASLYPGYAGPAGASSVIIVSLYGALDGAVGGALVGLVYNAVVHHGLPRGERFSA
ncbi:MAG: hypothetical protein AMS20_02445 [Gemmatimonas sp. SG8_28]|jgi:hypothetical protein|nr:MAG: hypothetical protein AMS20_02445 [Gemmatimonas sp. SG8_28]